MAQSISASQLVNIQPGVLAASGNPLSLNSVFLTTNTAVPIGTVQPFPTSASVTSFFGAGSTEATLAAVYFNGFTGSNIKPSNLYFSQYNTAAVSAYVRTGSLSAMTLDELKAISGTLILSVDGVTKTSSSFDLAAATSFTNAATIIQAAFSVATIPTVTYDTVRQAFVITSTLTGATSTGGAVTGTAATALKFTSATGAVLSQGAAIAVQSSFMDAVINVTQNWGCFMTCFEPVTDDKTLFATWVNSKNDRYLYVCWDSDANAIVANNATAFGPLAKAAAYDGVCVVYPSADKAAFICGTIGSIDFNQREGRTTLAFRGQSGLTYDITDDTQAINLKNNGYSFYGAYATANQQFVGLQNGNMPGRWLWIDPYVNQIYFNSQLQLQLMVLMQQAKSLPYNNIGYGLLRAACQDPINQMLNFGAIRTDVPLSESQAAQVNTAAGLAVDKTINTQGYYLQILPASAQVRQNRQSPPMTLWYTDGGSIQYINLASIDIF